MKNKYLFIFLVGVLLFGCSQTNSNQPVPLTNKAKLIDSLLNAAVNNGEIPGAVAFISKEGQEVYHKAFGFRKLESKTILQKDDIFRMASMTKALTSHFHFATV